MLGSILRGTVKTRLQREPNILIRPFLRTLCGDQHSVVGHKNFVSIRKKNLFYVDKTEFAEKLLEYPHAVLMKPPRSGKTLFLEMLNCLFDKSYEAEFDDLFGDLHVGKSKAAGKANTFYVLTITLPPGSKLHNLDNCHGDYNKRVMVGIQTFLWRHPDVQEKLSLPFQEYYRKDDYVSCLTSIRNIVGPDKLMVLVDEYDRAPMEAYISQLNTHGTEGSATANVKEALQNFLFTLKDLGCRYLVTGIHTVPGMRMHAYPYMQT